MDLHACAAPDCVRRGRQFLDAASLNEHAEAVHSFSDIECLLRDSLREKYGKAGTGPNDAGRVYTWVVDVAEDWVVFQVETASDSNLYKAGYSIDANNVVSLAEPVEVVRRTVYEPIASSTIQPGKLPGLEGAAAMKGDAQMTAAQKSLTAAQFAQYKKLRAGGMVHGLALNAAKKAKD